MTLSKTDRLEDADLALRLMMEELGEREFFKRVVSSTDTPPFDKIFSTTWQYLEDQFFIEPLSSAGRIRRYMLSGSGWLRGQELTGKLNPTKEKAGKVMAAIKNHLEPRKDTKFVSADSIAAAAGVPLSFVRNMVESDFIENVFRRKGAKWHRGTYGNMIEVPVNFGHELP